MPNPPLHLSHAPAVTPAHQRLQESVTGIQMAAMNNDVGEPDLDHGFYRDLAQDSDQKLICCAFERAEIEKSIGERFRRVADALPARLAIKTLDQAITYQAFDELSDHFARVIQARNLPVEIPVAILLEEGITSLAVVFGILKAGRAFVVIAVNSPLTQQKLIWEDMQKPCMITNTQYIQLAADITGSRELLLTVEDLQQAEVGKEANLPSISPDTLAALLYTSGTTGLPKGVMWSHRFILHTAWQRHTVYGLTSQDRYAVTSTYVYAAGLVRLFSALLCGATLYLQNSTQPDDLSKGFGPQSMEEVVRWLDREAITFFSPPMALLREWLNQHNTPLTLPHLRLVMSGTQALYRRDVEHFQRLFPKHTELSQQLSTSETLILTDLRINSETKLDSEIVPSGWPVQDKEILLWDEKNQPVAAGEIGQIVIRSRYLAAYWRQPALNAAKFLPDPAGGDARIYLSGDMGRWRPDGMLEHLGRKDNMVKVRGYTVQLEAVESALRELPGVRDAACAVQSSRSGEQSLVAYLVPSGEPALTMNEMRQGLAAMLPHYMIPTAMMVLAKLPQTAAGKINRRALPKPRCTRPLLATAYVAPRQELERLLCDLWAGVLEIEQVGVEDDFFDLGGDSLLSIRMATLFELRCQQPLPPGFYHKPTVAHLVALLQGKPLQAGQMQAAHDDNTATLASPPASPSPVLTSPDLTTPSKTTMPGTEQASVKAPLPRRIANRLRIIFVKPIESMAYRQGMRRLARLCHSSLFVNLFCWADTKEFQQMLVGMGATDGVSPHGLQLSLLGNMMRLLRSRYNYAPLSVTGSSMIGYSQKPFWRTLAQELQSASVHSPHDLLHIRGLPYLEEALAAGRGVILLTYHTTAMDLGISGLVNRLGMEQILTLSGRQAVRWHRTLQVGESDARLSRLPANSEAYVAETTYRAQQILQRGQLLQIANDIGYDEQGALPFAVGGRRYPLKSGFAELALATGAVVIPQYSTLALDGSIHLTLLPALPWPAGTVSHSQQVYELVKSYADFLNATMCQRPESMIWDGITRYLGQPLM